MNKKRTALKVVGIVIVFLLVFHSGIIFGRATVVEPKKDVSAYFENYNPEKEIANKSELNISILQGEEYKARLITLSKTGECTSLVQEEIQRVEKIINNCKQKIEEIEDQENFAKLEQEKWTKRESEYPVATSIWKYMKNKFHWNDYVCAGVLGNIMTEAGGQSLNIQPNIHDESGYYYGICQWSAQYYPSVQGQSLEIQLEHLENTVQKEFDRYGFIYADWMDYEAFTELNDFNSAALAFAQVYERCGNAYYGVRQSNAEKAFNYFH